jgi:pimeloyl-ACP methyl ester carboxylesterase
MAKAAKRKAKSSKKVDLMAYVPFPAQAPQTEGIATLKDTTLFYSDTGGKGPAVILMHPAATGNPLIWAYQQPVLVKNGYRCITYARRGYYKSGMVDPNNPGNSTSDLLGLIDFLGIDKCHLISTAAGGSVAADFALAHPERLITLAVTSNYAGVREGYIWDYAQRLRPPQWNDLPRWFREFGPSYICAHPEGIQRFIDIQDEVSKRKGVEQHTNYKVVPETLETLRMPTLLLTGEADLSTPPSLMKLVAKHVPNNLFVTVPESGHSPYWEYPLLFNKIMLEWLGAHSKKAKPKAKAKAKPKAKARAKKKR